VARQVFSVPVHPAVGQGGLKRIEEAVRSAVG